ncbi:MAG: hypothetical protein L0Z50_12060 [Verrucomicrobiales bacterium]|nr:hypothetical protein [Verrucomicrobiales bacterium]
MSLAETQQPPQGANDQINGNEQDDIILGGGNDDAAAEPDPEMLNGNGGDDGILGDYGQVILVNGLIITIESTDPGNGGDDTIQTHDGHDAVIAGAGADTTSDSSGNNVILGDSGKIDYTQGSGVLETIETVAPALGGNDAITTGDGADRILGGIGNDTITAGEGDNIVIGDNGLMQYNASAPGFDSDPLSLDLVQSNAPEQGGGDDVITSGAGNDWIIGGDNDPSTTNSLGGVADTINAAGGKNVVLGDNGQILAHSGNLNLIVSTEVGTLDSQGQVSAVAQGGDDDITTGSGDDTIIAGFGLDTVNVADGNNVVIGDSGSIDCTQGTGVLETIETIAPHFGGNDTLTTGLGNDTIFGGAGNDAIVANQNETPTLSDLANVIIGDNGLAEYSWSVGSSLTLDLVQSNAPEEGGGSDNITAGRGADLIIGGANGDTVNASDGNNVVLGDNGYIDLTGADGDPADIDLVTTSDETIGGTDNITTGAGNDLVFGGTADDTITAGAGNDILFGDHGKIWGDIALNWTSLPRNLAPFQYQSIATKLADLGGNDLIYGDAGQDIVIGGQGDDTLYGGADDDDLFGGHNVANGDDANDRIDGGLGVDVIAGDNASILRRTDPINLRVRSLNGSLLYDTFGNAMVNPEALPDPRRNNIGAQTRDVLLYDHSDNTASSLFGNDYIAGGGGDDEIFAQLGDDTVQGDGSIGTVNSPTNSGASRATDGTLIIAPSFEAAATDGDDYIEGGGGNDVQFGNLGQDDMIGGSSDLYGLTTAAQRPDGDDIIFGGAGTRLDRYALGQGGQSVLNMVAEHAFDADVILGDNGNILTLVDGSGAVLVFSYDSTADVGSDQNAPQAPQSRGSERVFVRVYQLLDYTIGDDEPGIGGSDLIKGEDSDDIVHGQRGNDVLYGDGWDDDLYGGTGSDRIFGGSGEDGIVADDGVMKTSRNGTPEPLHGMAASTQTAIEAGNATGAVVNITGLLKKTVDLLAFDSGGTDIVYGGLGDDFIHGGAGNDALSGAEALPSFFYDTRALTSAPFAYDAATGKLDFFVAENPRPKITGFLLNFEAFGANAQLIEDGKDWIFGDLGHDAVFGGTGTDRLFGGFGDDYLQLDDNVETNGGLNDTSDNAQIPSVTGGAADFGFGGGGRDVLIGNTGSDRMFDWSGEYNSYYVPFSRFGTPSVVRLPNNAVTQFLQDLGRAGGADPTITEPDGELGLVTQADPQWSDQNGGPRDPQPGTGNGQYDGDGAKEDDTVGKPLQDAHGSTPTGVPGNPTFSLSISGQSVNEGSTGITTATASITLSGLSNNTVAVDWATANGTALVGNDYTAASGTVTFVPGETTKTVRISVIGDSVIEPNETFNVILSNASGATISTGSATMTIVDDDTPPAVTIVATTATASETNPGAPLAFVVTRTGNTTDAVTINLSRAGTATFNTDYNFAATGGTLSANGLTLTLSAGVATATMTATPINDTAVENPETVVLGIAAGTSYAVGNPSSASGSITSDDMPVINVGAVSVTEGRNGTKTVSVPVTLSVAAPYTITATATTMDGSATAGSDYVFKTQTFTFTAGSTQQIFSVVINGDRTVEPNETFNVVLSNPSGATIGPATGTVTILNDD